MTIRPTPGKAKLIACSTQKISSLSSAFLATILRKPSCFIADFVSVYVMDEKTSSMILMIVS